MSHEHKFTPISRNDYQTFYEDERSFNSGRFKTIPVRIQSQIYECIECVLRTNRPDIYEAKINQG